jgi:predicted RNase H-like HicB family nuclease
MPDRKIRYLSIVVEQNDDGYLACCPGIAGAFTEGDTIDAAIFNCVDVIKLIAAYRGERGEAVGVDEVVLTPGMRVSVALPVEIG